MPMSAAELDEKILAFIRSGEGSFEQLALDVFEYQYANNEPYRQYCMRLNATPDNVHHWKQIPAVPTLAFKFFDLTCEPPDVASLIFLSSGTAHGAHARSKHYVFNPELYRASACEWFKRHVLPDDAHLPFLILFPPWEEMRTSSLAYMLDMVACEFSADNSAHFVRDGMLMLEGLVERLLVADSPVCLLGTSLAFCELLDYCWLHHLRFRLPIGSRLMDTGGFKGQRREVSKGELYSQYEAVFGIPNAYLINEYGMAEMCSQFYDAVVGQPSERVYQPPPWVRTLVLEPNTLEEVADGEVGVLRHYDLANRGSVMVIQTNDMGRKCENGFILLGRAPGAEPRGCSLLSQEWHLAFNR